MLKLKSFDVFSKMFEEEKTDPGAGKESSVLELYLNELFSVYFKIASYLDDYDGVLDDIKKIQGQKLDQKASEMVKLIDALILKIKNEELKKILQGEEFKGALINISKIYEEAATPILDTEESKEIEKKISDLCYSKIQALIKIYKEKKSGNVSESLSDIRSREYDHLFEKKNIFKDEREKLLADVKTQMSNLKTQIDYPLSDRHASKIKPLYQKLEALKNELEDDNKWLSMKRKNRIDRLSKIPVETQEIYRLNSDETSNELGRQGLEKDRLRKLKEESDKINKVFDTVSGILTKQIEQKAGGEEKTGEKDNEGSISSGLKDKENLTKKGPNLEKIREVQEMLNQVLPEKDRLAKADGLYGEKTEKAVEMVSSMLHLLNPEIEITGKKMSKLFIETLTKLIKEKGIEEIRSKFIKK